MYSIFIVCFCFLLLILMLMLMMMLMLLNVYIMYAIGSSIRPVVPDSYDIDLLDVQSVVALNMKEKQLWFLKCLSILQRPWEVGK